LADKPGFLTQNNLVEGRFMLIIALMQAPYKVERRILTSVKTIIGSTQNERSERNRV
jgi:hypothetical protein